MDWEAWWATVHSVAKSRTRLSDWACTITFRVSAYGGAAWVPEKRIWSREHRGTETHCSSNHMPWNRAALAWKSGAFSFHKYSLVVTPRRCLLSHPPWDNSMPLAAAGLFYLEGGQVPLTIPLISSLLTALAPTPKGTQESTPTYASLVCFTWNKAAWPEKKIKNVVSIL